MTGTQLIYRALRDIGCLRSGQTTSSDVLADCLAALNEMIDAWTIEGLLLFWTPASIFTLTAGQQQYTIGPSGATFVAARPTEINNANIILNTVTPVVRIPLDLVNVDQWAAIRVQALPFAIPQALYYDRNYNASGAATINLWPGPMASYQLELFTPQALTQFADLVTNYTFPPGYGRALRKCLAVEIAPMMDLYSKSSTVTPPRPGLMQVVKAQADEALEWLRSYNAPNPLAVCDPAFASTNRQGSVFNWATGERGR